MFTIRPNGQDPPIRVETDLPGHRALSMTTAPVNAQANASSAPLRRWQLIWLAAAVVVASFDSGTLMPLLPRWLEPLMPGAAAAEIAQHVGLLCGAYAGGLLIGAPLWGGDSGRVGRGRIGTALASLLGKPAGILGFAWVSVRLRLARLPQGARWSQLAGALMLAGIGFTTSLLFAGVAFGTINALALSAKIGVIVGSLASAVMGIGCLALTAPATHRDGWTPWRGTTKTRRRPLSAAKARTDPSGQMTSFRTRARPPGRGRNSPSAFPIVVQGEMKCKPKTS